MLKHSFIPLAAAALLVSVMPVAGQSFPDGPGKDILEKKCSSCHSPSQVTTVGRSADEWYEVIVSMIDLGAEMNDEETKVLTEYLAKNYPANKDEGAPAPSQPAPSQPAPSQPAPSQPDQGQPDQNQPAPNQPAPNQPEQKVGRAPAARIAPVSSHGR